MEWFFLIISVFTITNGVKVKYIDLAQSRADGVVRGLDLDQDSLKTKFFWLYLVGYEEGEDQLETISNLSDLEHVDVYSIGQKMMPIFANLSKLKHISMKGNQISYISNGAISRTPVQEVFLDNNQIRTIETWAFGPKVNTIYLSCNNLEKFSPRWFENASNIREMDLSGNKITSLPEKTFERFSELSLIVLSHNKITKIGAGAFSNRNSFWILYLDNNLVSELSSAVFASGSVEFQSLHLENNRLMYLDEDLIAKTNATTARIYGNPWQCPCYDAVEKWAKSKNDLYNKVPSGVPKCVESSRQECKYVVDADLINKYEAQLSNDARESTDEFCRNYLQ